MRMRPPIVQVDSVFSRLMGEDTDRLAASLHGRRSHMAEGGRLTDLCRIRSVPTLADTIFPGADSGDVLDFQRLSVYKLARELSGFASHLSGPAARLLRWMLVRFQVENLKVLVRSQLNSLSQGGPDGYLVPVPKDLALDVAGLSASESLDEFASAAPAGLLREGLRKAFDLWGDHPRPFFVEAVLDREYLQGLLDCARALNGGDREIVKPMVSQEVDIFHLMLVVRGKFHYGLKKEVLMLLRVPGTRITGDLFEEMLDDPDLHVSVERIGGLLFDEAPFGGVSGDRPAGAVDVATLERLAWKRFFRLSNSAFRRSHMGLAAVVGYVGIRRVEIANLITLSEGVRKGMSPETIRARMITYRSEGTIHV
jgi:vacuolar-type H+-ATPase subunit C/Vma6